MVTTLLKEDHYWIRGLYPLILEDARIGELLLELSCHCKSFISIDAASGLAGLKDFLVKLAHLPDKEAAMEKLFLMIYFPESSQLIYNTPRPISAFRDILMKKLAEWRLKIAMEIDWEGEQMGKVPIYRYEFNFTKVYYEGYRESSMFDDFILSSDRSRCLAQLKKTSVVKGFYENFLQEYRKNIITKELQGTVYSIIRDSYETRWGPIDPLSEEIKPDFEKECVELALKKPLRPVIWFISKYVDMILGAPVPISRLILSQGYCPYEFIYVHCWSNPEVIDEVMRKIYNLLAYYFRPRKPLERWDFYTGSCEVGGLFEEIWDHNIAHCDFVKSFEVISETLDSNQVDYLTRTLLLRVLKGIVEKHYISNLVLKIDFTSWTDGSKAQLSTIFGKLHRRTFTSPKIMS